jgi:hypothetical protein
MMQGYGIVPARVAPALSSRHTEGRAIDMSISWTGDLVIKRADGTSVPITTAPRSGLNPTLQEIGASFNVIKFTDVDDPSHWSSDGH